MPTSPCVLGFGLTLQVQSSQNDVGSSFRHMSLITSTTTLNQVNLVLILSLSVAVSLNTMDYNLLYENEILLVQYIYVQILTLLS